MPHLDLGAAVEPPNAKPPNANRGNASAGITRTSWWIGCDHRIADATHVVNVLYSGSRVVARQPSLVASDCGHERATRQLDRRWLAA
jgi:hypothetical protein